MAAVGFMVFSVLIIATLGVLHLVATFGGPKLHPVDGSVKRRMQDTALVLTKQTNMWRAWIGFNASHSLGALLFGAVYSYLALAHGSLLFSSWPLLGIGLLTLAVYWWLAKVYWFVIPFAGISLALACYVLAIAIALL